MRIKKLRTLPSRLDLMAILDLYHGPQYKASTDHKDEVSIRSGEGREKVRRGAFMACQIHLLRI